MVDFNKPHSVMREKICDMPFYTEGPLVNANGTAYFTTLTGGKIFQYREGGEPKVWGSCKCPNGQASLPNGDHLVCDSQSAALKRFDTRGNWVKDEVMGYCADTKVSAPNDVIVDNAGGVYFTDSIRHEGRVFYKGPDGIERVVATELDYPNGLVLAHDGKQLFVAESYANRILVLALTQPGHVKFKYVFADLPQNPNGLITGNLPDGLAMDVGGRLWVAHYGMAAIHVFNSEGDLLTTLATEISLTSNLCFLPGSAASLLVTGGTGEPGPGIVIKMTIENS